MKIVVKVTKEILERSAMCGLGEKFKDYQPIDTYTHCPVAHAVREIFPLAVVFKMHMITQQFGGNDIQLPVIAQEFIEKFDSNKDPDFRRSMSPISFEIEVPETVIEKIGIGSVYKILSESRTLELVAPC